MMSSPGITFKIACLKRLSRVVSFVYQQISMTLDTYLKKVPKTA